MKYVIVGILLCSHSFSIFAADVEKICITHKEDAYFASAKCRADLVSGCRTDESTVGEIKRIQILCKGDKCNIVNSADIVSQCAHLITPVDVNRETTRTTQPERKTISLSDKFNIARAEFRNAELNLGCTKQDSKVPGRVIFTCSSQDALDRLTQKPCQVYSSESAYLDAMARLKNVNEKLVFNYNDGISSKYAVYLSNEDCQQLSANCSPNPSVEPKVPSDITQIDESIKKKLLILSSELLTLMRQESLYEFAKNPDTGLYLEPKLPIMLAGHKVAVTGIPPQLGLKPGDMYVQFVAKMDIANSSSFIKSILEKKYPKINFELSGEYEELGLNRFAFRYTPKPKSELN